MKKGKITLTIFVILYIIALVIISVLGISNRNKLDKLTDKAEDACFMEESYVLGIDVEGSVVYVWSSQLEALIEVDIDYKYIAESNSNAHQPNSIYVEIGDTLVYCMDFDFQDADAIALIKASGDYKYWVAD